jgi:hypothetical protein
VNNRAAVAPGFPAAQLGSGGIHFDYGSDSYVGNTIVAGNTGGGTVNDIFPGYSPGLWTAGHNLIGIGSWGAFVNGVAGDRVGTLASPLDPKLGPLAYNGGPTLNRRPLLGSPAIDAADASLAPAQDQTGASRTGLPDIGAVEVPAPFFTSAPLVDLHLELNDPFSHTVAVAHTYGAQIMFSMTGKPWWLTYSNHGGGVAVVSAPLGAMSAGTWTVVLTATDGTHSVHQSFVVHVNAAPTLNLTWPISFPVLNAPYEQLMTASDPDGDPVVITAEGLPDWLTLIDNGNGTAALTGTPNDSVLTSHVITLQVSDGGTVSRQSLSFSVRVPPTFTSALPPTTAWFNETYSHTIRAGDANGGALAISATGLPAWLTLVDNGDATATLSGVPTDSLASSHEITLRVGDGQFVTEQSFTLQVPMERFRLDEHGTLIVMGGIGRDVIQVWVREGN